MPTQLKTLIFKVKSEWYAATQDEIEDLFGEEWETDESDSTLPASTESWQPPVPVLESWEQLDPGFNRIINESDLDSEVNFNFEAVIDEESPFNCPFLNYKVVESEDGSKITNSEEEAIPPRKRGRRTLKIAIFNLIFTSVTVRNCVLSYFSIKTV